MMQLAFGISFDDLYTRDGLIKLDATFVGVLKAADVALFNRFMASRAEPTSLANKDHSQLLLDLAPQVEDFIGKLFGIEKELRYLAEQHHQLAPLYSCKRIFVQRRAAKTLTPEEARHVSGDALLGMLPLVPVEDEHFEMVFATVVMGWLEKEEDHKSLLEIASRYAAWALYSEAGCQRHAHGILFKQPKKLDPEHLVPVETENRDGIQVLRLPKNHLRARQGFALTDDGGSLAQALDNSHYCIFCHHHGRDSCSKGMKEKVLSIPGSLSSAADGLGAKRGTQNTQYKKSTLGITLAGCPLEEKISEMNEIKSRGFPLGALAVVVIDNPMCAGTGHRICNDCMKSCIYQKQDPVNIPQAETRTLKDILALPYGFEIYSLLTRWNPLNFERPLPKKESGYKVLVAGLGPAGYTLAHHLMNDGHVVVGVDGLKIEPVAEHISGVTATGERVSFEPIKDISTLTESLDERSLAGFGGVAEYGITVRWDKNYLKIIRLLLERRAEFSMIGGVRFGSSLTYENAHALGFDHIALCMGAGRPTLIDMKNGMARGVRAASDFLMALQLTGAAKKDSIANLQLRLPVVVIGGGLTAIDTATESLAYYSVQVEKFLTRYEALVVECGEQVVRAGWSEEDNIIAEEFITHGRAIREERKKANPDIFTLLDEWGGVKLVYRKRLIDAPSYRLNHEEVEKAFEEGIFFAENWEPAHIDVDHFGHAASITLKKSGTMETISIPARAILVAAGTNPNTVLAREDTEHFELDGKYFRAVDEEGNPVSPGRIAKPTTPQVLMASGGAGCSVSFFGDLHPSFAGNVVKAMGSAKQGYPVVTRVLKKSRPRVSQKFLQNINAQLRATVHEVKRLTPTIVEVVIHAPLAAARFEPGQFYRLQNFEALALRIQEKNISPDPEFRIPTTILAMEGLAMTGAWVDREKGLVSVIALEMGGSSDLCAHLKPGEPVVLMGPTGTPTHIPAGENILLAGGGLGNAVLFSIGKRAREKGSKVLYFAGYKKAIDRYKVAEIEAAADQVIWCCDETALSAHRPQDASFHGNIVEAMVAYAKGEIGKRQVTFSSIDRLIAIGSDRMMAAVAMARHGALVPYMNPKHTAIGSINSPMQCMMKEICAQCLQKHINPETGTESYVYSCFNQDQLLDTVSWEHLNERLKQNSVQEKLTMLWIDVCLKRLNLRTVAA
ncbi:MAG: FAD-dependent oxidoreductase [Pseudomonadota bacterium]|nr:FAD-dependent oxidoreductase [Pseudomonadota bacterium]MDE3059378.1 FAD-dependent oxidoreductase [Pseudomonadota bacterium]